MTTSPAGLTLIQPFEGCRLEAYQDGKGVWTIGTGHTAGVKQGDTCTQEQADAWLAEDVVTAEAAVTRLVKVPLTQSQFDALVSFTFNLGQGRLAGSTLLRLLNAGLFASAADEFPKWDLVAGEPSAGLLRRREAERELFLSV